MGKLCKITRSGHRKSFVWLPWLSAFRFLLTLDVLVQLNGVYCHGMVIMVIKLMRFVGSRYSRLSIKLIVHVHFRVLRAYTLVHLTGECEKHVLSDKLKYKGIN